MKLIKALYKFKELKKISLYDIDVDEKELREEANKIEKRNGKVVELFFI